VIESSADPLFRQRGDLRRDLVSSGVQVPGDEAHTNRLATLAGTGE